MQFVTLFKKLNKKNSILNQPEKGNTYKTDLFIIEDLNDIISILKIYFLRFIAKNYKYSLKNTSLKSLETCFYLKYK